MTAILEIDDYSLDYRTRKGSVRVLDNISLSIAPGEVLGLVGESGSGKTSLAWAIMRALPPNAVEPGGRILLDGQDLRSLDSRSIADIRGRRIGMVFQDPSAALNPTLTLGRQITEVLRRHRRMDQAAATEAAIAALARVGLHDPYALMRRYPHQASGGEKQRVMIAAAFAAEPELIICDEVTSALDQLVGEEILRLLKKLQDDLGVAYLFITHDLSTVKRIANKVAVMLKGKVVAYGPTQEIFAPPYHPYTELLLSAVPEMRPEWLDEALARRNARAAG